MRTLPYILHKYNLKNNKSKHKILRSRTGSLSVLFKELDFNLGAEIGIETGRYSKFLCTVNPDLKLFAVDIREESTDETYAKAQKRLEPLNCEVIRDWSQNAAKQFDDKSLDFVYISAFHDYKNAMEDIKMWSKKVKKGGIVSGYNYYTRSREQPHGVKQAVNQWVKKKNIQPLFIFNKDDCPTWFYVKK